MTQEGGDPRWHPPTHCIIEEMASRFKSRRTEARDIEVDYRRSGAPEGSQGPLCVGSLIVPRTIVSENLGLSVDLGLDVNRPPPDPIQVLEGSARIVELQRGSRPDMLKQQFTSVAVISILDMYSGPTAIGELIKERALDGCEVPAVENILSHLTIISVVEQFVLIAEILGKKLIDERDVIMTLTHFEYLFHSTALAIVPLGLAMQILA